LTVQIIAAIWTAAVVVGLIKYLRGRSIMCQCKTCLNNTAKAGTSCKYAYCSPEGCGDCKLQTVSCIGYACQEWVGERKGAKQVCSDCYIYKWVDGIILALAIEMGLVNEIGHKMGTFKGA
jgi:hypothetical protein